MEQKEQELLDSLEEFRSITACELNRLDDLIRALKIRRDIRYCQSDVDSMKEEAKELIKSGIYD